MSVTIRTLIVYGTSVGYDQWEGPHEDNKRPVKA